VFHRAQAIVQRLTHQAIGTHIGRREDRPRALNLRLHLAGGAFGDVHRAAFTEFGKIHRNRRTVADIVGRTGPIIAPRDLNAGMDAGHRIRQGRQAANVGAGFTFLDDQRQQCGVFLQDVQQAVFRPGRATGVRPRRRIADRGLTRFARLR